MSHVGQARKLYPLTACEKCGKPGVDRHHKDENHLNNAKENIAILCRECHMGVHCMLSGKRPRVILLSKEVYKRLERQARKLDRSLSYVARQAVMEWVKARESEA